MEDIIKKDKDITLETGKTYNLLVGIHVAGCGDVIYLSNMLCTGITDDGYLLKGVPGTIGSLQEQVKVYKDEIFAIFDMDLYECLTH